MINFGGSLIQRAAKYFDYQFVPHPIILMYHRITDLSFDPQLLSVSPQHFNEHLEIIRQYARPMSLKELTSALQQDKLPRHGVAITFDDGYADNLQYAKPLLECHDIPATVFITAGHVGGESEFWWDELDRLLLLPGELPSRLSLEFKGVEYRWHIGEAAIYTEEDHQRYRTWHIELLDDPTTRHMLYRSLYHLLHSMDETERQRIIQELQGWANQESKCRPSHRTLTREEVFLLARQGLMQVGAHTVTHPVLASLPVSIQREEIKRSKDCLQELVNYPINSFSYPHGSYTGETISLVKELGFSSACSSDTAFVSRGADVFCLPRFSMRDWDGEEFYRWLKGLINI